jgi:hypothetical protein
LGAVGGACLPQFLNIFFIASKHSEESSFFVKANLLFLGNRERRVVGPVAWRKEHKERFLDALFPPSNTQHYTKCPKLLLPGGPFLGRLRQIWPIKADTSRKTTI